MKKLKSPYCPPADKLININWTDKTESMEESVKQSIKNGEIKIFKGKLSETFESEFS